ncbi:MAG: hypothetical protein N4A62_06785 [Marinisporobacter sp.]|jgi:alpha-acetolactate decarboxylase|nr:hypothetical protein [Marinisporobacter sp.]MCV6599658.1 hypothetical protein [Alphaproteobacteria bacterium]
MGMPTFKDIDGNIHYLDTDNFDISVDYSSDIITNDISNYFVIIEGSTIEVSEAVYHAVDDLL